MRCNKACQHGLAVKPGQMPNIPALGPAQGKICCDNGCNVGPNGTPPAVCCDNMGPGRIVPACSSYCSRRSRPSGRRLSRRAVINAASVVAATAAPASSPR